MRRAAYHAPRLVNPQAYVLIVEDDAATQLLLEIVLRRHGFACVVVSDGESALEWLKRIRFDAVLLDLVLPRCSGFDVIRRIEGTSPDLLPRVIVCTALPAHQVRGREELQNVGAVFVKPAEVFDVAEAVIRVSRGGAWSPAFESRSTHTPPIPLHPGR